MNLYELMFILNPELGVEECEKLLSRLKATIDKYGGNIIRMDDMGLKTLSYKILNKSRGHYILNYLEGPGSMIPEIERFLKLDENVVRFIIIKLDKRTTRQDLEPKVELQKEVIEESVPVIEHEEVVENHAE